MNILVTGGAGYIGSHTCALLLEHGYDLIVVDNLCNSKEESLRRVQQLTEKQLTFYKVDLLDRASLDAVFTRHPIDTVIHFAGFKAPGESVIIPLQYFNNNLCGTLSLLDVMKQHEVKNLVFSSSATVYDARKEPPYRETDPLAVINPYGRTKLTIEDMLRDLAHAEPDWNIALLRYFNPVGAHPSGQIGEDPSGIPNNLMPYIAQVVVGRHPYVRVWGNDYPTPDGTCLRDYIHVMDLAEGHIKAMDKLSSKPGLVTYNLGTGHGYSVLEVIKAFEKACGRPIPYQVMSRREGDSPRSFSDPSKANQELKWRANKTLDDMCLDAWRWQSLNPQGFA